MKPTAFVLLLLMLSACKKEKPDQRIALEAKCRECAVEFRDDGATKRDTILWQLNYTWVDGVAITDTVESTCRWNIVLPDGEGVYFSGCKVSDASSAIELKVSGDASYSMASTEHCVTIGQP